jgi:hypothetical protein
MRLTMTPRSAVPRVARARTILPPSQRTRSDPRLRRQPGKDEAGTTVATREPGPSSMTRPSERRMARGH